MIWLTWRQFRTQAIVTGAALTVLTVYLVVLGRRMRGAYTSTIATCTPPTCGSARAHFVEVYGGQVEITGALLLALPAVVAVFWGAPLVTAELQARTDRLVWQQSVTRTRWLAVKLTGLGLVGVATAGLFSLLLTWSASRYDQVTGDRFAAVQFAARNVVPLGHAAFGFVLGVVAGLLVRRTVPAMAVALAVVVAVQVVVPAVVRAHLMSPVTARVVVDAAVMADIGGFGANQHGARIEGYRMPGTWPLSVESRLYNPDGSPLTSRQLSSCMTGDREGDGECLAGKHLWFDYTYHPASRYWPFQWIELAGYLGLTVLLAAAGFGLIRRRST